MGRRSAIGRRLRLGSRSTLGHASGRHFSSGFGRASTQADHRHPVDAFFSSLAEDQKGLAVGIVLSGTGNNGSRGLKDIQAAGGLCFAQDPDTADYDGMPRAAIAAGVADHLLPPEEMPRFIL